ncbi:MAG: hypothetical protein Q9160_001255 [Pyrenula sp. 1 TL-2023]
MHKYRSEAKRLAWYDDNEDGTTTFNPFRKHLSRTGRYRGDAEEDDSALQRTQSEKIQSTAARRSSDTPAHAQTTPSYGERRRQSVTQGRPASAEFNPPETPKPVDTVAEKAHATGDAEGGSILADSNIEIQASIQNGRARRRLGNIQKLFEKKATDLGDTGSLHTRGKQRRQHFTVTSQLRATVFNSWLNLLFVLVPVGFAVNYTSQKPAIVFTINFVAIFPSSTMLAYALEEVMLRVGETLGGLLSMTFSNAVQLISSILLLKARQIVILQSSLLGSILANLLLTMGLSFFFGGLNRVEQYYNVTVAQTVCMLLLLAVLSIVIPTCSRLLANATSSGILAQSRGTAIIVIISYGLWLIFQFKTHREMLAAPSQKAPKREPKEKGEASKGIAQMGGFVAASMSQLNVEEEENEEEVPHLSAPIACFTLVFSTVLVAFNTEFATSSIRPLLNHVGLSQSFFGLVIIPLLSLEPTSIVAAIKDKMHLTVALTLERCMQTALMVVPITILLGWCMSVDEMTLEFDGFSIAALFASVIIVAHVVQEGKSNWLTGALLIKVYLIIALASYFIHLEDVRPPP